MIGEVGEVDEVSSGQPPAWLRAVVTAVADMEVPSAVAPPPGAGRPSAVLVLFGDGPDGPDLLIIQRNAGLRRHAGQPAFPGGAVEAGDASPVAAALREAAEEVGVRADGVQVLGAMPELYISRSGFRVMPVIAWWREPCPVRPLDTGEVAAVERISLAELADPVNRVTVRAPSGHVGPGFAVRSMLIWGFTAVLVDQLLAMAGFERPWDRARVRELAGPA